jgi:hypothetical protein
MASRFLPAPNFVGSGALFVVMFQPTRPQRGARNILETLSGDFSLRAMPWLLNALVFLAKNSDEKVPT